MEYSDEIFTESNQIELIASEADIGKRLDSFISENTELSRSAAARLIEDSMVLVGDKSETKKAMREYAHSIRSMYGG